MEDPIFNESSIDVFFNTSLKHLNDKHNKIRESIIAGMINNKVPDKFYMIKEWLDIKTSLFCYLEELNNYKSYSEIKCKIKGGRCNKYDFVISFYDDKKASIDYMVEFKYNACNLHQVPQFVSPVKPSQYLNNNYEEFYFDNYLPKLINPFNFKMPNKNEYLKEIHSIKPKCVENFQELYYNGYKECSDNSKKFYQLSKRLSKESIEKFIIDTDLKIKELSSYLYNSQERKVYMLYSNNKFTLEKIDINNYIIDKVIKNPKRSRYECISKNGEKINVLLRWKNGNGIAFPAFQIKSLKQNKTRRKALK